MDKNSQNSPKSNSSAARKATEQVILTQIDQIYGIKTEAAAHQPNDQISATNPPSSENPTQSTDHNPYEQTYQQAKTPTADWQAYHSAWQNYYQKYYEYYYVNQLKKQTDQFKSHLQTLAQNESASGASSADEKLPATKINPRDQALHELREKLRSQMTAHAKKARKSRHFWPAMAAFAVILIFLFLQYNRFLVGQVRAYITPADTSPTTIVVDPTFSVGVGPESRLIIPKINVNVPVTYDIGNDNASQQEAMKHGVAHFAVPGASSHPGEIGNTPISGHSSNDVFEQGDYKFIFAQLDRLEAGDLIYADYQGIRYTYTVTKKEVVWPNEWEKLVYPTAKPVMTLITCTPIGTTRQRLLVTAEQISPDPDKAAQPTAPSINITKQAMPGESPSFLERLFGAK